MKHESTLADLALQDTFREEKYRSVEHRLRFRDWIKTSHKFMVDNDMVDLMVQSSIDLNKLNPRLWLSRLPFERTWIEFSGHQLVRAGMKFSKLAEPVFDNTLPDVPPRLGFLLVRDPNRETRFTIFQFLDDNGSGSGYSPIVYFLDSEEPISDSYSVFGCGNLNRMLVPVPKDKTPPPEIVAIKEEVETYSRIMPLGIAHDLRFKQQFLEMGFYGKVMTGLHPAMTRVMENVEARQDLAKADKLATGLSNCLKEERGIVRKLITLLAMINTVPIIEGKVEGSGYRPIGMNRVRYMNYSTITLKLPKKNPIIYMERYLRNASREQEKRRAHPVRMYWKELRKSGRYDCQHDFKNVEANRYECQCGRTGWWIKEHVRGDASRGWVHSNYEVTT